MMNTLTTTYLPQFQQRMVELLLAVALVLISAGAQATPLNIAGYSFSAGEQSFADDAFVTSGAVTGANAATVRTVLIGSNTEDSIRVITPDIAEIEIVFSDNAISNGSGTDLVIFERSGSSFPVGSPDANERFGFSVWDGSSFTPFVNVDPVNTGTISPGDPTLSLYVVEIDLDAFGFAQSQTTQRIKLRLVDNLVSRSADPTAFGALNSVAVPEPMQLALLAIGLLATYLWRSRRSRERFA